ncbi:unnamed protein product [Durusdinium trenchii]|uniref:Uncharacterized protein n=1 Tax=Durusdinium trenchii TaxID=1381693 RepID=A0ABP0Q7T1_9DINO
MGNSAALGLIESSEMTQETEDRMAEVGMPVGKASSMTRFFEELHQLLGRLSPGRRRAGLAELRPLERQGLEAWILARQSDQAKERRRLQGPKMPRSTQPSSGARSSVVTFSQRTLKGTSRWYYAVVCLPGLHILSRMRRQRHSAVEDSKVLADAKRRVSEASRTGRSFDQAAVRCHGVQKRPSEKRWEVRWWREARGEASHDLDDDHADVTGVEGLPVPRCMLADAIASKTRKKLKSASTNARNQADLAIKKCKDKEEQACLEQAVHGNCKWCEGLCGPNAV